MEFASMIDGMIVVAGGIWATLLGYRKLGPPPGANFKYDRWHKTYGRTLRIGGPLLSVLGVVLALLKAWMV